MERNAIRSALALPVLGLLAAGCGSSQAPHVASLGSTAATTGSSSASTAGAAASPDRARFASCLTAHGFTAAVGSAGSTNALSIVGVVVSGNVDPSEPQFRAAMAACRKYLPGGGPPAPTPAQAAESAKAMRSFAACMRKHGVPGFPDPNGQGLFPLASIEHLDRSSPLLQAAFKACQSLEPARGPRIGF